MKRTSEKLAFVLIPIFTTILCFGAVEVFWRLYEDTGNPFHLWDPEVINVEPKSSKWIYKTEEFTTTIRTNSRGFRGNEFPGVKSSGQRRIVFLGDSMTAAKQVEENERFANRVDAILDNTDTVALGQDGANPVREILYWRAIGSHLNADIVIQQIYPLNDILYPDPDQYIVDENGLKEVFLKKPNKIQKKKTILGSRFIQSLYDFARRRVNLYAGTDAGEVLGLFLRHTQEGLQKMDENDVWKRTAAVLKTTRDEVEKTGATYTVLLVPSVAEVQPQVEHKIKEQFSHLIDEEQWRIGDVHNRLLQELRAAGISVIDTKPALQSAAKKGEIVYFFKDGHINERGHEIVTETIVDNL
jgi:hypothetical protein